MGVDAPSGMNTQRNIAERGLLAAEASWDQVGDALENGAIAVLPVGAAAKEHGKHLPMNTDQQQAEWLARRLVHCANVVVWPTLTYGYYPAFVDFPGSCSLSSTTFECIVIEVAGNILNSGARGLLILNTGISTIQPVEAAARRCVGVGTVRVVNVYSGVRYTQAAQRVEEQPRGGHADELETSIMLAIEPASVRMERAEACVHEMVPGRFNRRDPERPNYTPSGVYGDPRRASAAKGAALAAAMLDDVLTFIRAWQAR